MPVAERPERQASHAATQNEQVQWKLSKIQAHSEVGRAAANVQATITTALLARTVFIACARRNRWIGICTWSSCPGSSSNRPARAGAASSLAVALRW